MFKEINWKPSIKERQDFGRELVLGFPFVALFWTCLMAFQEEGPVWHWDVFIWIAGLGCGLGALCVMLPALVRPIYCIWFFLVGIIDKLIIWTILPIFFYLVLFPCGLLVRTLGKSSIKKKPEPKASYWIEVEPAKSASQYFRQF
jgi:hypothetical protein